MIFEVMDTLEEIQERDNAIKEVEKELLDLHQIFLDFKAFVEPQGDLIDNIEKQVSKVANHVQSGNAALQTAKKLQKSSRKWMCGLCR